MLGESRRNRGWLMKRMDIGNYFECKENGSCEIEGWMKERNVFLGHAYELLDVLKCF